MAGNMNKRDRLHMFSTIRLVLFCVLLGIASSATSTAPPAITNTTQASTTTTTTTTTITTPVLAVDVLGQCPCDTTGNACDVNCCCDEDCSTPDRLAFSQCLPISQQEENRVCFQKELFLFENSDSIRSETTQDNQFCIYRDNSGQGQVYSKPDQVTTLSLFQDYRDQFYSFSTQTPAMSDAVLSSSFYQNGDPIYIVTDREALGMLGLPRPLTSMSCVDGNPAAYLKDERQSCVRSVSNLTSQCASLPGLDAQRFFTGFRVVTNPQLFQVFNISVNKTVQGYSLYNSSFTVEVKLDNRTSISPLQCRNHTTGVITPCPYTTLPSPSLQGDVCRDMLYQLDYTILTNGSAGIIEVLARFVLTHVPLPASGAFTMTQTFSSTFQSVKSGPGTELSGNPGYIVGQPLLAGTLNQTTDATGAKTERIELNTDRDRYMTLVKSLTSGLCTSGSEGRIPVLFGYDIQTGCNLSVMADNLTHYCSLMQKTIISTLEFDSVPQATDTSYLDNNRYVGLYGNSDTTQTGNWVKILYLNRPVPSPPIPLTSICRLSLGMTIQVMFANIGAKVNPQPKVIAVAFIYNTPVDVQVKVSGAWPKAQGVFITNSVSFLEVSKEAVNYDPRPSIYDPKVPGDFFYPFATGAASHWTPAWTMVIFGLWVRLLQ